MPDSDVEIASREFACQVVRQLVEAGFVAYWAGGCVRDQLMGRSPKDYDVATSARPEQVREVFGRRRTIPVGQAFGVITVLGRPPASPIEVATFRREANYSDGRHPDEVSFTDAREDAYRRDFTINGMFFDPLEGVVHDFVGGQADLRDQVIRAIGNPEERISEDKLRMLRAVRFAATFDFVLEPNCLSTIRERAADIHVVSAERITAELQRMFSHPNRLEAIDLLLQSYLLREVLPEAALLRSTEPGREVIRRLPDEATFAECMSVLLSEGPGTLQRAETVDLAARLKLPNSDRDRLLSLNDGVPRILTADESRWPAVQRVLASSDPDSLLRVSRAWVEGTRGADQGLRFCEAKVAQPREVWDPPALLDGNDLQRLGVAPGKDLGNLLFELRNAQLRGEIRDTAAAEDWVLGRLAE